MATAVDAPHTRIRSDDRVRGLALVGAMAALMWVLEIVDIAGGDLDANGIHPRDVDTLPDIAFAPFLHAGWGHLIGNTVPFLVLGGAIALSGLARTAAVTAIVALVGGLGTWLIGPADTNHIGASGIVFGFAAYLIARGIFSHRALHLAAGVAVIAVYGATLLFGFIPHPGIS
jgi:membrane associated rhomboid family serine protease